MTPSERTTRWRLENPVKYRAQQVRRNVRRLKAEPQTRAGVLTAYSSVHNAIKRVRGKAGEYPCARCGKVASDWAFEEPTGFSTDWAQYRPLCRSCHLREDYAAGLRSRYA